MELQKEQVDQYIKDLLAIRNDRLIPLNTEEDTFGGLVADAMNSLELVYIAYRGLLDDKTPQAD